MLNYVLLVKLTIISGYYEKERNNARKHFNRLTRTDSTRKDLTEVLSKV